MKTISSPLQGWKPTGGRDLGRCPRLAQNAPIGAKNETSICTKLVAHEYSGELASEPGKLGGKLGGKHTGELEELPGNLAKAVEGLDPRPGKAIIPVILALCQWKPLTASQIARYLGRKKAGSLQQNYLRPLISSGELAYLYPESEKHPKQAYRTPNS